MAVRQCSLLLLHFLPSAPFIYFFFQLELLEDSLWWHVPGWVNVDFHGLSHCPWPACFTDFFCWTASWRVAVSDWASQARAGVRHRHFLGSAVRSSSFSSAQLSWAASALLFAVLWAGCKSWQGSRNRWKLFQENKIFVLCFNWGARRVCTLADLGCGFYHLLKPSRSVILTVCVFFFFFFWIIRFFSEGKSSWKRLRPCGGRACPFQVPRQPLGTVQCAHTPRWPPRAQ